MADTRGFGAPAPSRRARVLVVSPDYPPSRGGIQTLIHRLATGMAGLDVNVLTLDAPNGAAYDRDSPVAVRRVRAPRDQKLRIAVLNAAAASQLLARPPAVVLSAHSAMVPATALGQSLRGLPVLQYFHANEITGRPALARRAADHADIAVCVSRYTRELLLAAGGRPSRVELIPPGVDLPAQAPGASRTPTSPPTLVTVARLRDAYKGHDVVLRALRQVRELIPGVHWNVVGDGPLRAPLETLAAELGVADLVTFHGAVDDAVRDRLLLDADVFVMPSRLPGAPLAGEGFGIVLLEAAAMSLPVVAGAAGGALDAVEDGVTGLLVDPEDPAAVADALIALLENPARARAMGRAGAERAEGFAWPLITARVEALLIELSGRR